MNQVADRTIADEIADELNVAYPIAIWRGRMGGMIEFGLDEIVITATIRPFRRAPDGGFIMDGFVTCGGRFMPSPAAIARVKAMRETNARLAPIRAAGLLANCGDDIWDLPRVADESFCRADYPSAAAIFETVLRAWAEDTIPEG